MTTTTVHADGRTVEVTPLPRRVGLDVSNPKHDEQITVLLTPDQARTVAAALNPYQGWPWTRDDLPSVMDLVKVSTDANAIDPSYGADAALNAVVTHLNTHHPKPDAAAAEWLDRALNNPDEQLVALDEARIEANIQRNRAERERDAAIARADAAEKRHKWPKMTPTGHAYIAPRTYAELCHLHGDAAQAAVESWEADECPPEPTWEMVGIAHREVERLRRECDEMRPFPAVTRADVEFALGELDAEGDDDDLTISLAAAIDAVCDLLGIEAAVDPVEDLSTRLKDAARDALRTTVDAMTAIVPALADFDSDELVNDISHEQWRTMARNVLKDKASGDE